VKPGITIQHARETSRDTGIVRCDVTGIVGIIPKANWPKGGTAGDYIEFPIRSYADLTTHPGFSLFDPVTVRAIRSFYENGGTDCHVIAVCIESENDLMTDDPFNALFIPLLDRLRGEEDIALLTMPVLAYLPVEFDNSGTARVRCQGIMEMLLNHCQEMNNRFVIFDTPRDLHEEALQDWVNRFRKKNLVTSMYGAVYYPWLQNGDELFPPSGAIAGIYARTDREHKPMGVRWPPANTPVRGVTHPAVPVKWSESGILADAGINPILSQPGRGTVVWGARTMSTDPKWIHINARRIVNYISEQIRRDSEWIVFEHMRPQLYKTVELMVAGRIDQMWEGGLLTGDQPRSEYMIQCDEQLNPPEVRDAGQINVSVTLRPISTTEFIVVELRLGAD
jgi:hypothetical protein